MATEVREYRPHPNARPVWIVYGIGVEAPFGGHSRQLATCHDENDARFIAANIDRTPDDVREQIIEDITGDNPF